MSMRDLEKANAAIAQGDWAAAEISLRRLARGKAAAPQVFYNLAKVLIEAGKPAQAGSWLDRAVRAAPDYAIAWFELGRWRLDRRDWEGALEAFLRAAECAPEDVDAWRNAARLAERLCRFALSARCWEQVAARKAEDIEARLGCARAAFEQGAPDEAEALLAALPDEARALALTLRTRTARGRLSLDPARI